MNKKAFTLIEVLAVVIILAIIALISTPMVIKVLNEAEKKAFKESVNGMIRAVNNDSDSQGYIKMDYTVNNGNLYDSSNNKIHTSGGDKEIGSLTINEDGEIALAVHNDKWCAIKKYDNNKLEIKDYINSECEKQEQITLPVYSVSPEGDVWAKSKAVTITYPERKDNYIYQYSVNGGSSWETVDSGTTATYTFNANGNIIARIFDGADYYTASALSVTKIDTTAPTGVSVAKTGSTSNSITVKATGTDSESGIMKYEFSKDNGETWINRGSYNTYIFNDLTPGSYDVKVRVTDKAGNSTTSSAVSMSTKIVTIPTYSVSPEGDVWAKSKTVTINYPEREDNYVYQYSIDGGSSWETLASGTSKKLIFSKNGTVIARIYDGEKYYTASSLSVTKIDTIAPTEVSVAKTASTVKSITVKASGTDSESGIGKYEFSKDNGETWISNGTNSTYTFTNLAQGLYEVKVRVTDKVGNSTTSSAVSMSTNTVTIPTYSVNPEGDVWARSKTVTINYPERESNYVYQYSIDGGSSWETVASGTTATYTFNANGNIIARIYDGEKYYTASSLSISKIDTIAPTGVSVAKTSSTVNSITVKASGTDSESGIGKYEFSKDNGATWISNGTNSTYTFTNLKTGTYQIKTRVTDNAGNSTISSALSIDFSTIAPPESFETDSWETIADAAKKGNLDKYEVGDEKEVTLTGDYAGTYTVRIANMTTSTHCSNSNYSQSACGFVIEFKDIITEARINQNSSNRGGWPASEIYNVVNSNIYNSLPEDLKKIIIDTNVVSSHGVNETQNFMSTDKLYLLATKEIYGKEGTDNEIDYDTTDYMTRQLDYYKKIGVTTDTYSGAKKQYKGKDADWWLRSAHSRFSTSFAIVTSEGLGYDRLAQYAFGVAPAFRIMSTSPDIKPTYSVSPEGDVWAKSKTVTIKYPEREDLYKYEYSVDGGNNWNTVYSGTTATYTFNENGNIIARIYDGYNYYTASSLSVSKIDTTAPTKVSVAKTGLTLNSITVKANGTDSESGIGEYEFSKDNGKTWISNGTNSTYTFTDLAQGSYKVKVRVTDKVGNSTISSAELIEITPFAADSWETIAKNIKNGNSDKYEVGDEKDVTLTGEYAGTYTLRIANTSTPTECSGSDFSQTACGFVVEFKDALSSYMQMNSIGTNVGGYPSTELYNFLNTNLYNSLPEDLKKVIIDTKVVSSYGSEESNNFITTDKLYLLATKEVWGKDGTTQKVTDDESDPYTRQLDYYKSKGVMTGNYSEARKKKNGSYTYWWLRSAHNYYNDRFYIVLSGGGWASHSASSSNSVSPAFRIG